jgi:Zn-dependent protease with chaperone function
MKLLALAGIAINLAFLLFVIAILDVLLKLPEIASGALPFMLLVAGVTIINVSFLTLAFQRQTITQWQETAREFVRDEKRFSRVVEGELA